MKASTIIIEPAISQWVADGRVLVHELRSAEDTAQQLEKKLHTTREAAKARAIELGLFLLKVRAAMPKRGTKEHGWKAYLEAIEVDDSTAHRYMDDAKRITTGFGLTSHEDDLRRSGDDRPLSIAPPPTEADASPTASQPRVRGSWCTPAKYAKAIGRFDLDPFSNDRSHIDAEMTCELERGDDGFGHGPGKKVGSFFRHAHGYGTATEDMRVWLQPDYAHGFVIKAVQHYGHTRFAALLRLDPSTEWFAYLWERSELILVPKGDRIEFDAPDGVESSSNPFPHGFFYARAEDANEEIRALCYPWPVLKNP